MLDQGLMVYNDTLKAIFINRPNRFIANVSLDGDVSAVHVKNTGRCREILRPGVPVILEKGKNPGRKTPYSLISAYKGDVLINIDSQVPNQVVAEAVKNSLIPEFEPVTHIKREATYGRSRFDIYYESNKARGFIEVKGVTLEVDGVAMFPDAPTERGARHVCEMVDAVNDGYKGCIFFLIQLKGISHFTPNRLMDPEFGAALDYAHENGVEIIAYDSIVTENSIELGSKVPVIL